MDITNIGLAISLVSISLAILKISLNGKKNNYVKRIDCHQAMNIQNNFFDKRMEDLKNHIDRRIDDLKDFIKTLNNDN